MEVNEEILRMVKSYPILYDPSHAFRSNALERQKVWNKIGKHVNMDPDSAKMKYRHIKNAYQKCVKKGTNKYKYQDLLDFLATDKYAAPIPCDMKIVADPHPPNEDTLLIDAVKCRPLLYNREAVDIEIKKAIWEEVGENLNRSAIDCEKRFRNIKDTYKKTLKAGKVYKYQIELQFLKLKWDKEDDNEVVAVYEYYQDDETTDDLIPEQDTSHMDEDMPAHDFEDSEEDNPVQNEPTTSTPTAALTAVIQSEDALQMYFSSIYATVKNFEPRKVAILQKKIFDLVHEVQMGMDADQRFYL